MNFVYGSKRPPKNTIKNFRTHVSGVFTEESAKEWVEFLKQQKEKDVKMEKFKMPLPSICPNCNNKGSPSIYKGHGTVRISDEYEQKDRTELRLIYNHSKTKPKTCVIGTVNLKKYPVEIKLKTKFKKDVLGFSNRTGIYSLK